MDNLISQLDILDKYGKGWYLAYKVVSWILILLSMANNNYPMIYDCGNLKFKYTNLNYKENGN